MFIWTIHDIIGVIFILLVLIFVGICGIMILIDKIKPKTTSFKRKYNFKKQIDNYFLISIMGAIKRTNPNNGGKK